MQAECCAAGLKTIVERQQHDEDVERIAELFSTRHTHGLTVRLRGFILLPAVHSVRHCPQQIRQRSCERIAYLRMVPEQHNQCGRRKTPYDEMEVHPFLQFLAGSGPVVSRVEETSSNCSSSEGEARGATTESAVRRMPCGAGGGKDHRTRRSRSMATGEADPSFWNWLCTTLVVCARSWLNVRE